jgi:hypothetical protein
MSGKKLKQARKRRGSIFAARQRVDRVKANLLLSRIPQNDPSRSTILRVVTEESKLPSDPLTEYDFINTVSFNANENFKDTHQGRYTVHKSSASLGCIKSNYRGYLFEGLWRSFDMVACGPNIMKQHFL